METTGPIPKRVRVQLRKELVWFLIETAMRGYRIIGVFLGTKDHASFSSYADDLSKLSKMGEQVAIAIIREAIKYERIDNVKATLP
jgi:hypothetical protein